MFQLLHISFNKYMFLETLYCLVNLSVWNGPKARNLVLYVDNAKKYQRLPTLEQPDLQDVFTLCWNECKEALALPLATTYCSTLNLQDWLIKPVITWFCICNDLCECVWESESTVIGKGAAVFVSKVFLSYSVWCDFSGRWPAEIGNKQHLFDVLFQ